MGLRSLRQASGCAQGRVGTLWPVGPSLDQMMMLDVLVLNRRIKLRLALGMMVLGVPAWVLAPSLEFCPAGQMRLGPN